MSGVPILTLVAMWITPVAADAPATQAAHAASQPSKPAGVALIQQEAKAVAPLVKSDLAKAFLRETASLPSIGLRKIFKDNAKRMYYSAADAARLGEADRADLVEVEIDEDLYYTTKYGTPLAYVRPLDLLGQDGVGDAAGMRILDFGYGTIGHLRLLAQLGAEAVGVDVDPLLKALYSEPDDQGPVATRVHRKGQVTLVNGQWPAQEEVRKAVGDGYDLFISKNTLKNGYLHPDQPLDKRMLIDLGVDDASFVKAIYDILEPGGRAIIYNICPAPSPPGKPYIPWADGRCPFPKDMLEAAGFAVIAYDQDDCAAVREMAHAFGWDAGEEAMDLQNDLFAHYTLLRKPGAR